MIIVGKKTYESMETYKASLAGSSKGGRAKFPGKGFASDPEAARIAGTRGGRISRRKPKVL